MIIKALKTVFLKQSYLILAAVIAIISLLLIIWLPNIRLFFTTVFSSSLSINERFVFVFSSLQTLGTNFTPLSALLSISIAILFAMNIAMLIHYIKKQSSFLVRSGGTGFLGLLTGTLGTGCASCGSMALSLFGLSGALTILPFGGNELSFVAIGLLLLSLYSTSKKISENNVCQKL